MSQRLKSEKEFFQESFLPQIAVRCSYDAEVICRKNNLTFIELIQPFSKYHGEIKILDPSNNQIILKNLKVEIKDINHIYPSPIETNKILQSCVISKDEEDKYSKKVFENNFYKINTYSIFVASTSHLDPLDQFQKLVIQEQSDSNQIGPNKWFFNNFNNVYKYFVLLHDVQEGEISKAHSIFESLKNRFGSSNCHLLQINSKSLENQNLNTLSQEFDPWLPYCRLNNLNKIDDDLKLNETNIESYIETKNKGENRERHGMFLSLSDHDRIKTFFSEFLNRGLIPYAEKTIKVLNEQYQSKKNILKGFSISKKFFGLTSSSQKSSPSPSISLSNLTINSLDSNSPSKATNTLNSSSQFVHSNDDLNVKRLGDLTFLFQFYDLSFNYYISFKKDYSSILNSNFSGSDNSLLIKYHFANALEMSSISSFLNSSADQYFHSNLSLFKNLNVQYIEEALHIYINECKNPSYSTRCVLFLTEILRAISNHTKAANYLINFYPNDNNLRRCLFLEQAAYNYLNQSQPCFRKYAFFLSLASEKFENNNKTIHSVKTYENALQAYLNKSWVKVLNKINYSLSCQNHKLNNTYEALKFLEDILLKKTVSWVSLSKLSKEKTNQDQNDSSIEKTILKKFINLTNTIKSNHRLASIIRLPFIDSTTLKINLNPKENFQQHFNMECINIQESSNYFNTNLYDSNEVKEIWKKIEEAIYISYFGTLPPLFFKPHMSVYDSSIVYNSIPTAFGDEFIEISFKVLNDLKINLILKDCVLLWKFLKHNLPEENKKTLLSNNDDYDQNLDFIETISIDKILIPSNSEKIVSLLIKPKESDGNFYVLGMKFKLEINDNHEPNSFEQLLAKQFFEFKEKRNNHFKKKLNVLNKMENYLNFKIIKKMPLLQVNVEHLPDATFCNQIQKIDFSLLNLSEDKPIGNIKVGIKKSDRSNVVFKKSKIEIENNFEFKLEKNDNEIIEIFQNLIIKPKQRFIFEIWIQTNEILDKNNFYFLFSYQELNTNSISNVPASKSKILEYRLVKFRLSLENTKMIYTNVKRIKNPIPKSSFVGNIEIINEKPIDEMSVFNIFSISKIWKITDFKKREIPKPKNTEKFIKSKKLSHVFKVNKVNSEQYDQPNIAYVYRNLFKDDSTLEEISEIIENFCKNRCDNYSENYLILYFLIIIRQKENVILILKDIFIDTMNLEKSSKKILSNQNKIFIDENQNEKFKVYYCKSASKNLQKFE